MVDNNKVQFGLRNVHYWPVEVDNLQNTISYGTVKKWPGAVSLSLDPSGDPVEFKADDVTYYYNQNNQGYSGTLTTALVPDDFRVNHLGEKVNTNDKVQFETSESQSKTFAIAFEVQGDKHARRYIYYSCNASRPAFSAETSDTGEPQTQEISFVAGPRSKDYMIKANTLPESSKYDSWFTTPWEPTAPTTSSSPSNSVIGG